MIEVSQIGLYQRKQLTSMTTVRRQQVNIGIDVGWVFQLEFLNPEILMQFRGGDRGLFYDDMALAYGHCVYFSKECHVIAPDTA